jgi:hypothetical protein
MHEPAKCGLFCARDKLRQCKCFSIELFQETKTMAEQSMRLTPEQTVLYNKLSTLQKRVCMNILHGMTRPQAYKAAEGKAKESVIPNIVSVMMKNAHVKAFMDEMYSYDANQSIMSRDEAMQIISGFARAPAVTKRDRIRSVERLARMQGWDAAQKHDLTGHILTSDVPLTDAQRAVLDKTIDAEI